MKKILTVSLGALLIATAANADIASVDYVTNGLAGKQDTISGLDTIRSGAAAGATALQKADITTGTSNGTISVDGTNVPVSGLGSAAYTASTAYATAAQGTLAASAVQPGDLGALATKSTIASGDITDGAIMNADIATNAQIEITKISGLQTALNSKQDKLTIDSELSKTSTNPLQNKVVTEALSGKQATLTTSNIKGSGSVSVAIDNGVITVSGTDNNTTYSTGTASTSGLTKLYTGTGSNTDGTMTQSAITTALSGKQAALGYTPENVSNKVPTETGLTASSTDTQYPSAKLVYTALNKKQDKLTIDSSLNTGSTNPVQNTAVAKALNEKQNSSLGSNAANKAVITDESGNITSGTIASGMIASNAVTTAKIADGTIATGDIADSAVTTAKIADGAVTSAKIANSTIVDADISSSAEIAQSKIAGLTVALADKQVAAPVGESGDNFYVTNNDGAWVDMFTAMPRDPECAEEKCALTYKAGKYGWEIVRQ